MQLLPDESVEFELRPHWAARLAGGLLYVWGIAVGLFFLYGWEDLLNFLKDPTIHSETVQILSTGLQYLPQWALFSLLLVIPCAIKALMESAQRFFWGSLGLCGMLQWAAWEWSDVSHLQAKGLMIVSLFLLMLHWVRTAGIRYVVTSRRIVLLSGTFQQSERALLYDRIQDLVLQRSLAGRLFGYGSVVPITSSQLGMGQANSSATVGAGTTIGPAAAGGALTFGQGRHTLVADYHTALHCISAPTAVYNSIMSSMGHA